MARRRVRQRNMTDDQIREIRQLMDSGKNLSMAERRDRGVTAAAIGRRFKISGFMVSMIANWRRYRKPSDPESPCDPRLATPKSDPRTKPKVLRVTGDMDAPAGFKFYVDLDPRRRRFYKSREAAETARDEAVDRDSRQESYFAGALSEDEFLDPEYSKRQAATAKAQPGPKAALSREAVLRIVELSRAGHRPAALARQLGISAATVSHIMRGWAYTNITGITPAKKRSRD